MQTAALITIRKYTACAFVYLLALLLVSACGGGGGGGDDGGSSGGIPAYPGDAQYAQGESYQPVEVHLGYVSEVSATRINFPSFIDAGPLDWINFGNQFQQLGELTAEWDAARRGETSLPETRNVQRLLTSTSMFSRQVRIIRTDWETINAVCGTNAQGRSNHGCAYHHNMPYCTIYVPRPEIYQGGISRFHELLGHEMWHCLVGAFH